MNPQPLVVVLHRRTETFTVFVSALLHLCSKKEGNWASNAALLYLTVLLQPLRNWTTNPRHVNALHLVDPVPPPLGIEPPTSHSLRPVIVSALLPPLSYKEGMEPATLPCSSHWDTGNWTPKRRSVLVPCSTHWLASKETSHFISLGIQDRIVLRFNFIRSNWTDICQV